MRICMVAPHINPPWIEGGKKSVFYLSRMLVKAGSEVHIVTTEAQSCHQEMRIATQQIDGIVFHRARVPLQILPSSKYTPTHVTLHTALTIKLLSVLKAGQFDILHGHSNASPIALRTLLAKEVFKLPTVHTIIGESTVAVPGTWTSLRGLALLDKVIVTAESMYKRLLGKIPASKLAKVPYGVDTSEFTPGAKSSIRTEFNLVNNPLVLYAGHFFEEKGVEYLIQAAPLVLRQFPEARFLMAWNGIGEPRYVRYIQRLISELRLSEFFIFIGQREDIAGVFATSSVCVVPLVTPRHTLAHPMTILEALATATPVIGTCIPGVSELINDHENGFLVPPRDYQALADRICMVLSDNELRDEMGRRGREVIEKNFALEDATRQVMAIYESIVARGGR